RRVHRGHPRRRRPARPTRRRPGRPGGRRVPARHARHRAVRCGRRRPRRRRHRPVPARPHPRGPGRRPRRGAGVHDGQMTRDDRTGCRPAPTGHEPRGPATSREDRTRAERTGVHDLPGRWCAHREGRRPTTGRGPAAHDRPGTGGARPARLGPWSSTWPLDRPPRTGDPGRSGPPTTVPRPPPPAPRRTADDRRGTGRSRRAPAPRPPRPRKGRRHGGPADPRPHQEGPALRPEVPARARPPPPAPRRTADDRRGTGRSRRAPAPRPPSPRKGRSDVSLADTGPHQEGPALGQEVPARGRPRSEAVERAIIEGVMQLLEDGVPLAELSIERIARTAGVGKATIYRRWSGKEQLFVDVMRAAEPPDPELPGVSVRDDLVVLLEALRLRGLAG